MQGFAESALEHVFKLVFEREPAELPHELACFPKVVELHKTLIDIRETARAFSEGNISRRITSRGYISGGFKSLQANLKHLTWQVRQVENADFSQHVSFMGEFSESFNNMTARLKSSLKELEASEARFRYMACHDPLTGALNRQHFSSDGQRLLQEMAESGQPFALLMLDLDKFKKLNDTYGHQAGDAALVHVVQQVKRTLREDDLVYRYGGEEFVVIIVAEPYSQVLEIAERIRATIESSPLFWEDSFIPVTASFGGCVAESAATQQNFSHLVKNADKNLYLAKEGGRNRVVCTICDKLPKRRRRDASGFSPA